MSLFSFSQRVAIDLGTANTIIISDGEIVVDEPSVVAIRKSDDKMIPVGKKASPMQERSGRPAAFSSQRHRHRTAESAQSDVSASQRIISVTTAESDNIPTHRENCCLDT